MHTYICTTFYTDEKLIIITYFITTIIIIDDIHNEDNVMSNVP